MTILRPYPEYKPSDIEWLGVVPCHWRIARMKTRFTERIEKGHSTEPLLAATQTQGVVPKDHYENRTVLAMKDLELLKLVRIGDFFISLRSFQGGIEFAYFQGIISPAYTVLTTRGGMSTGYARRLFKSVPFIENLRLHVTGIRQGQNIDYDRLRRSEIPCPPLPEQQAIADFLDVMDARISRYIAAKRRMIALLEEQKQAIINQAVTRGLDPDVPLKPSGVDWLGDIPAHWDVAPFTRYVVDRADYRGATPEKVDEGVTLVTAKNIRMGRIDYESSKEYVRPDQYNQIMRRGLPQSGDLLLTMEAPLGNVALVDREDVAFAQRVVRFRMDPQILISRYTLITTMAKYFQDQLQMRGTGSTAMGIKASKLPQLMLIIPPCLEQVAIADHVTRESLCIDHAIGSARRQSKLIQEYRTRLISDVVTGKLDVRGVELPAG